MNSLIKAYLLIAIFLLCYPLFLLANSTNNTDSNNTALLTNDMTKQLQQQLTPTTSLLRLKEGK